MSRETRIRELLSSWQARRQQGETIGIEELCRASPELLEEVRKRIGPVDGAGTACTVAAAAAGFTASDGASPPPPSPPRAAPCLAAPLPQIEGYEILGRVGR